MRVIIAAAGTGGHINPGIAIANKIKKEEPDSTIIFIGTSRGLENDLVPRSGYELKTIDAYGISRNISIENIKRLYKTIKSVGEAKKIIQDFKPDMIIGTGGYICVAVGKAALKCKVPIVLHESNAFPGMSVKLLAKKVDKILLGFKEAKDKLPKTDNIVVTGTPTKVKKMDITKEQIKEIKDKIGFKNDLPLILVFGGSQGAKSINDSLMEIINKKINKNYNLMWAAGTVGYDEIKEQLEKAGGNINNLENTKIVPYIYNMEEILNSVDLVVCRSGAMTINEISSVGKPAIFIPFPYATENHQEYNAKVLSNVNAAKIILDKDLTAKVLNEEIQNIINYPQKMKEMGINSNKIAFKNVEEKIYKEIKTVQIK